MAEDNIIVGLDIGTSTIRVAVGEVNEDKSVTIIATSMTPSKGMRNGIIVNIEDAKDSITRAIHDVEVNGGVDVTSAIVSVGGSLIESENASGIVQIHQNPKTGRKEVSVEDVEKVIEMATAMSYPADREKIHVIPQNYKVDDVDHVQNPINRIGYKLTADVHIITASKSIIQNIRACMERAGYNLDGVMLKTLAETKAVCHEDELELGSIIIDLGDGTTDVIVLYRGAPISTASVPVGGRLVTNDISVVTKITVADAEKIKIENGCCWCEEITNDTDVILPGVGGRAPEIISRSSLCEIIQARMEQIFTLVKAEIRKNTSETIKSLQGNIILTGGGAMMEGVQQLAKAVFKTEAVRIGMPEGLGGNEDSYRRPDFATAVGLVVANKDLVEARDTRRRPKRAAEKGSPKEKKSLLSRFKNFWF